MGLFSKIFSKLKIIFNNGYYGYQAHSAPFDRDAWEHDTFRATVDAIATHAAKGTVKHVIVDKNGRITDVIWNSDIVRLLNEKANEIMSGYDFKYRIFCQLENKTTAVAYIRWEQMKGSVKAAGIYPVDYENFEFYPIKGGSYALEFTDADGNTTDLPVEDCIVIRKFYMDRQASGDGNAPIYKVLDMSKAADEGLIESLSVSNKVRGILVNKKAMLDPADVKKSQQDFADRFKDAATNGGIVSVDSMEDYKPLSVDTYSANAAQMKEIDNRIYSYLRTPEEIVQSKYSEQTGMAWYESVIEPLWDQLAQAVTNVYFTDREKQVGNKIIITGGMLMGASYTTRVNVIMQTKEIGILTMNEQRELLGYAPLEDGDTRQVSLNYINSEDQSDYQLWKSGNKSKDVEKGGNDNGTGTETESDNKEQ